MNAVGDALMYGDRRIDRLTDMMDLIGIFPDYVIATKTMGNLFMGFICFGMRTCVWLRKLNSSIKGTEVF
jgi:hypothetical protein